jgi:hypothetical protein
MNLILRVLKGTAMRVSSVDTPDGALYCVYRTGGDFGGEVSTLVPFLLLMDQSVLIGGIGPLRGVRNKVFRIQVEHLLEAQVTTAGS